MLLGRSFLKESDFTPDEWRHLLELAATLKRERAAREERQRLRGKKVALLFEKTSTRTRCAFEVALMEQGGFSTYLDPSGSQIGHKESPADTARVLGRWYDAIEYRGSAHRTLEIMAEHAGVPVYNGLSDDWHPTQMLADQLTMLEHSDKPLHEISYAFVGDVRNNVGNSLLISGAMMGCDVRLVAPKQQHTDPEVWELAQQIGATSGASLTLTDDVASGVKGVDFVYTDVWVSLGEPAEIWDERIALLAPYQVNAELMRATGNKNVKFMHCLPAFHDRMTRVGEQLYQRTGRDALEVTNDVFEGEASIVFDQAENRMHTIKAVMVATLAGE